MIVRLSASSTPAEREAVRAALGALGVQARLAEPDGLLVLDRTLEEAHAVEVAAMPGVEEVAPATPWVPTVREAILDWVAAAAAVVGVLLLLAAAFPVELGAPADPASSPADVPPSWPALPIHAVGRRMPDWVPMPLAGLAGAVALLAWPLLARSFAERLPKLHTLVGVAVLAALLGLVALEVLG